MERQPRRTVTTTNHPGGGHPRLVLLHEHEWEGGDQPVFWLRQDQTTIGADLACDLVLTDLAPLTATIICTAEDEYVLVAAPGGDVRLHGAAVRSSALLRTGARLELRPHTLTYVRDEGSDHGRPFGGRQGGEAGHQRPNPPR